MDLLCQRDHDPRPPTRRSRTDRGGAPRFRPQRPAAARRSAAALPLLILPRQRSGRPAPRAQPRRIEVVRAQWRPLLPHADRRHQTDARSLDRARPRRHVSHGLDLRLVGPRHRRRALEGPHHLVGAEIHPGDGARADRGELLGAGAVLRRGDEAVPDLLVDDDSGPVSEDGGQRRSRQLAQAESPDVLRHHEGLPVLLGDEAVLRRRLQRDRRHDREGWRSLHADRQG